MSKRKRKEDPDSKSSCLKEIEELSKEINCLEDDLEIKQSRSAEVFSDESLSGIIESLRERHSSTKSTRKKANEEQVVQSLLSRIDKLQSLTGIIFEKNKAELISSSDDNNNDTSAKKWRRILSGKCFSLSFLLEMETEEVSGEEVAANVKKEIEEQDNITVTVTKLSFKVSCPLATRELNSFTATAEQQKAIGTVFIALKQYAKWYDCRRKTFENFKSKYPELVCIFGPEKSDTMEIRNQLVNGLHFNIHWSIHTGNDGHVLPQIDAFVACPSKVGGPERECVLNSTPVQFRKMLSRFGIEQAIECIIMIVQK